MSRDFRKRLMAWAALFALALHIVAPFGHVHASQLFVAGAELESSAAAPSDPTPDADERECALCAVLALAGAAIIAGGLGVALARIAATADPAPRHRDEPKLAVIVPFDARGPPALT